MELTDIKESFEFFDDWEDKYRFILEIGKDLPAMDDYYRIEESGCNGFMYTLDFTQSPEDEDLRIEVSDDLSIFVSPDKAELVNGTCIDLEIEGLNSNIVFKNPNAFSYCGCGESFSLGEDASSNNIESLGDIASEATS